jgi:hypothetical protein
MRCDRAKEEELKMRKMIIFLAVALAIPTGVALAKGAPASPGKSAPKVQYILKGTLSGYLAATSDATGQISIDVKHSNYHGRALKDKSLTFTLTTKSRVTFRRGSHAHGQIVDGTKGYLTVRAPKRIAGDLVTQLPALATRIHVVVLKAPTP